MARFDPECAKEAQDLDRLHDTGSVVVRARRDIPRVKVPADENDLVRKFGAANFADDIVRRGVGKPLRVDFHFDAQSRISGKSHRKAVCGERGEGGSGYFRRVRRIRGVSRVGYVVERLTQRARQRAYGATFGRRCRSAIALITGSAVGLPRQVYAWRHRSIEEHDFAGHAGGRKCREFFERSNFDHFGVQSAGG